MTMVSKAFNNCKAGAWETVKALKAYMPSQHSDGKVAAIVMGFFLAIPAVAGLAIVKGSVALGVGCSTVGLAALVLYVGHQLHLRNLAP